MAARWKERLVVGIVLGVALWPLAHRVVVYRYDVNPWKFAGWAMYATPRPPVLVALLRPHAGKHAVIDAAALPPHVQGLLLRFRQERHALGDLRHPDDLAAAVLVAATRVPTLTILVQQMRLDATTSRTAARTTTYVYDRRGRVGAAETRYEAPTRATRSPAGT